MACFDGFIAAWIPEEDAKVGQRNAPVLGEVALCHLTWMDINRSTVALSVLVPE